MDEKLNFAHLHIHSDYSLLDGYGKIKEYIKVAKEKGIKALALTDHNTMTGIFDFIKECKKNEIQPIVGVEFNMAPIDSEHLGAKNKNKIRYDDYQKQIILKDGAFTHLTVLAKNQIGIMNLNRLIKLSYEMDNVLDGPRIDLDILEKHKEGLIVLSGCPNSELNIRLRLGQTKEALEYAEKMKQLFGEDFYIEIIRDDFTEKYSIKNLLVVANKCKIKFVITNDVHYAYKEDSFMQEIVMAMGLKKKMTDLPSYKGGQRYAFGGDYKYLKSYEEMLDNFDFEKYSILKEGFKTITEIVNKIEEVELEYNSHLRPKVKIPKEFKDNIEYLKHLIKIGFQEKRGHESEEEQKRSLERIKYELQTIISNDFVDYFLVIWDFFNWCRENNVYTGAGRGCFLPDNKVTLKDGTKKLIKNIKVDDEVITHLTKPERVLDIFKYNIKEKILEIFLSNGESISCTKDHEIFTKKHGWVKAKNLRNGEILLGSNVRDLKAPHLEISIIKILEMDYEGYVYDLNIENVQNYTIGGVTVHNSAGGCEVLYLLDCTKTDPLRFNLLFERFISPGRGPIYEIEYEDGEKETISVSDTKTLDNGTKKFVYQLEVGDIIDE